MTTRRTGPLPPASRTDFSDDRARALALVPVSRETAGRLDNFVEILLLWQARTNLIAESTIPQLWTRHIADSLQLLALAPDARVWVDFGSGGGFPGLALACALAEHPGGLVHLVESNQKKAAFLREAARTIGVPASVHPQRAEAFAADFKGHAEVVTARGLAPLKNLIALAAPLLKTGALGLFPKGQDVESELTETSKYWTIKADTVASKTSPEGHIVVVSSAEDRRKA